MHGCKSQSSLPSMASLEGIRRIPRHSQVLPLLPSIRPPYLHPLLLFISVQWQMLLSSSLISHIETLLGSTSLYYSASSRPQLLLGLFQWVSLNSPLMFPTSSFSKEAWVFLGLMRKYIKKIDVLCGTSIIFFPMSPGLVVDPVSFLHLISSSRPTTLPSLSNAVVLTPPHTSPSCIQLLPNPPPVTTCFLTILVSVSLPLSPRPLQSYILLILIYKR